MALQWTNRTPERPDRYLDWEYLNWVARGGSGERWCSVLVQLKAASGADPAIHLKALRAAIANQPNSGPWTIKIHDDELSLLDARIIQLLAGTYQPDGDEDAGLAFFIYLPEASTYLNGGFAHTPHYDIRLAGPPIPGLRVNQMNRSAMKVMALHREQPAGTKPVAVGVIDHAIAFANERFRTRTGVLPGALDRSRVKHLWLQQLERVETDPHRTFVFGRHLKGSDIESAFERSAARTGHINERLAYSVSGAVDFNDDARTEIARAAGHGTHVMDLACGYAADDPAGDLRPILAVQLPDSVTEDTSGMSMASYVLQALRQIMLWADTLDHGSPVPLVVNFSYGLFAGPKDGSHALEREIDRLIEHRNKMTPAHPTAVVLPAGNINRGRVTAKITLAAGERQSIDWMLQPDNGRSSVVEIWTTGGDGSVPIGVRLLPPGGPVSPATALTSGGATLLSDNGRPVAAIYADANLGATGATNPRSRVLIAANPTKVFDRRPTAPSGCWRITLENLSSTTVEIELFVQRGATTVVDDQPPGRQSYFEHSKAFYWDVDTGNYERLGRPGVSCPMTYLDAISSLATGRRTITVGAAMMSTDRPTEAVPALYTSSGPTPVRPGPDLSAVADESRIHLGVLAAGTCSGSVTLMNGTSAAAPQITRLLADAGADFAKLKDTLGITATSPSHPQLGLATAPTLQRPHIPPRKRN